MALAEVGARLRLAGAAAFRRDAERAGDAVDRLGRDAAQSDRQVTNLGDAARRAGRGLGGLAKAAGGIGAIAGAAAIGGVAALGTNLFRTATELEALSNKAGVVFGTELGSVQKWAASSAEAMGLSANQAVGLAAGLSDLLVPIGFSRKAAATMSTELIGLSGALAQWSGGQYDAAAVAEILQGAMLGETDSLQSLGIAINAADVEAALLAKGMDKLEGNARKQAEAQAIIELVYSKSTDAQEAFRLGANKLGSAQAELRAKVQTLREQLATKLTPFFVEAMEWLEGKLPTIEGYLDGFADKLGAAVKPGSDFRAEMADLWPALRDTAKFGGDVLKKLTDLVNWMVDNETAVKTFAGAVVALKVGMLGLAAINFMAIATGVSAVGGAAAVSAAAFWGPVGLVAGIAAAIALFDRLAVKMADAELQNGEYTDPTGRAYPDGRLDPRNGPMTGPAIPRSRNVPKATGPSTFPTTTTVGRGGVTSRTTSRVTTPAPRSAGPLAPTQAQLNAPIQLNANLVLPNGRVLSNLVVDNVQREAARR